MPLVIPPVNAHPRTLLYVPLPSLTTPLSQEHRDLVRAATFLTSGSLTVWVDAPDASWYARAPAAVWDELLLLLGTLYVTAGDASSEVDLPLMDVAVIVEG